MVAMTYARLGPGDRERAKALFTLMAAVFDEDYEALSERMSTACSTAQTSG
jgi:hypothetical protein